MLHRYPDDLHKNLEIQFTVEELEILQKHYLRHIQDISKDNSVKVRSVFFSLGFFILVSPSNTRKHILCTQEQVNCYN